jgi:FkbM family methyltransferase
MTTPRKVALYVVLLVSVALGSGYIGVKLGSRYQRNVLCSQIPARYPALMVGAKELLGLERSYSQFGQDKWVFEVIFPGVKNGFFLDVGSADGTVASNTKALERRGWKGICVDPFPRNMQDRTCQMFKEVVFSERGKRIEFHMAGDLGGVADTLGRHKDFAKQARTVELTTVTLGDILERAKAPRFIHFVSLDIEGAELEALMGFPFDRYSIGALAVEHNYEEPKRSEITALMRDRGYERVHSCEVDDFYVPATKRER